MQRAFLQIFRTVFSLFLGIFSSCSSSYLHIQSDYLSHEDLASYHTRGPDERKEKEWFGQRLILSCSVPKEFLDEIDPRIELRMRYRNREQSVKVIPLKKAKGSYTYQLMNKDFFAKKGILTYQAKILSAKDSVKETWTHQLWTDLLDIELLEINMEKI